MANLIHLDRRYLDSIWPHAGEVLLPAIAENHGEATLDQVKMQLAYGEAHLLFLEDMSGFAVVELVQHPNVRVAHISYIGGKGIVNAEVLEQLKNWCRAQGASEIRALCDEAHSRLFRSVGLQKIYEMVGAPL